MNRISTYTISILMIILLICSIIKMSEQTIPYNFEDLKMQYKNYTVIDKYVEEPNTYVFKLRNPCNSNIKKVYVKQYLYNHVYYVGDTIK